MVAAAQGKAVLTTTIKVMVFLVVLVVGRATVLLLVLQYQAKEITAVQAAVAPQVEVEEVVAQVVLVREEVLEAVQVEQDYLILILALL
jgi:hypothetical protein